MSLDRVGEYFEVRRGLRQECVISPWLFNIFFDRVVRQVNDTATGRGVTLRDGNGGDGKLNNYHMQITQCW